MLRNDVKVKSCKKLTTDGIFSSMILEYREACAKLEERIAALDKLISRVGPAEAEAYACRRELLRSEMWEMLGAVREMEEYDRQCT